MSARDTLTPELRAEVLRLEDDLRARVASIQEVQDAWRAEYDAARAAERTAAAWEAWVDERVTLAAVAWVLTTVFVRFCEDNALVKPVWISGPRHREAIDAQQQFLRETARTNADVTDREWLLQAVDYLKSLPATTGLVDDTSPMWLVTPSGDAATRLLNFWRERDESGALIRDLSDPELDTRFLGDLYQEISEDAKKRYALLQTPVFVEEFILDRTLEPALNERPLEGFKLIDPTCGSGHFLLGGFQRLLDRWHKHAPGLDERERVQAALNSVYGVDINPFAVAIARFRLTVAALQACGLNSLADAPAFKYHLAAGDSLLHGLDQGEFDLGVTFTADRVASNFAYATENLEALRRILRNGQYDVVVGNPPYIQPPDEALNRTYRQHYFSCRGKYQLTVPFMERFFALAESGATAGWVGQITGNGFMKKEFGSTLVAKYLPTKDLRLVVDASGAYIPGHGTPTVIVVGRNARPVSSTLRAVLGNRAEPSRPIDPANGRVWSSIFDHVDQPGWDDTWVSVVDLDRRRLAVHPWSLGGGGSVELLAHIEEASRKRLADAVVEVGVVAVLGEEDAYELSSWAAEPSAVVVEGEGIRDFTVDGRPRFWPYQPNLEVDSNAGKSRWMWPRRQVVKGYLMFGKTREQRGLAWFQYGMLAVAKLRDRRSICFAEVATHNHFSLDLEGRIFKQSAPVIKLRPDATDDDFFSLLGVLNSSLACFWLRQVCPPKGGSGIGRGIQPESWMERFNFNSTNVAKYPLPATFDPRLGRRLDELARERAATSPTSLLQGGVPEPRQLEQASERYSALRGQMVAVQEELDWYSYNAYGIVGSDLLWQGGDLPSLSPGERTFELALARDVENGIEETAWFERHGSTPRTAVPNHWPQEYQDLIQRRTAAVASNPFLRVLERPEHKRRWSAESWDERLQDALASWLCGVLEDRSRWFDPQGRPMPKSLAVIADEVSRDPLLVSALELWDGRRDVPVAAILDRLVRREAVPFLAAHRYRESGLRKRSAWETTWDLQRREDRGDGGQIPVPPKYTSADFVRQDYWMQRGPLDVPKERFILYPGAGREGDVTSVVGWAGWDHAQQALALATLIQSGEQQGWSEERLTPFVAGLSELLPWVQQWHTDPDPLYGGSSPAEFFSGLLDNYMAKLGETRDSLVAWRPPAATRGRKAKS